MHHTPLSWYLILSAILFALGVAGFCLMLFALVYAASQYKKGAGRPDLRVAGTDGKPAPRRKQRKAPLLQRMEERFRRRFDDR